MPEISPLPLLGVIEGFYGETWSHEDRLFLIDALRDLGLDAYLYAPKADASLRKAWMQPRSAQEARRLADLAAAAEDAGACFGVGLSPFELYRSYDAKARATLQARLDDIRSCGVTAVALLFDDMPGDLADLAQCQAEIVRDVAAWMPDVSLRVCPTYYSDDPVLDRVFGPRPEAYLEDLGRLLPADVPLFWTGPQVCSEALSSAHLLDVRRRSGRPLALWDNYPVNDGKARSEHLYLDALSGRTEVPHAGLESHWCNGMNQMALSLPALASLARVHGRKAPGLDRVMSAAGVTPALIEACLPLAQCPRTEIPAALRRDLEAAAAGGGRAAQELTAWLAGAYAFDPACLTD